MSDRVLSRIAVVVAIIFLCAAVFFGGKVIRQEIEYKRGNDAYDRIGQMASKETPAPSASSEPSPSQEEPGDPESTPEPTSAPTLEPEPEHGAGADFAGVVVPLEDGDFVDFAVRDELAAIFGARKDHVDALREDFSGEHLDHRKWFRPGIHPEFFRIDLRQVHGVHEVRRAGRGFDLQHVFDVPAVVEDHLRVEILQ